MCKYEQWYSALIANASKRAWSRSSAPCYVECHHIVPRSLGGMDTPENLVMLTAREHFIAHRLLCKFGNTNQRERMIFALQKFLYSMKDRSHINSRTYNYIKTTISNTKSILMLNNTNRLGIPHTADVKQKMSLQRKGVSKSDVTKTKMSESAKLSWATRDIVVCPHCGTTSRNKSNMTRWHFNNCKEYNGD